MCITAPGQIVGLTAGGAVVEIDGARRRASTLIVPEAAVGDWVLVGAGSILRRLDPAEAAELAGMIAAAIAHPISTPRSKEAPR